MTTAGNRLGAETSPYLLQHADNPVEWRPWGAEALAEAAASNRPILLSIGYAACHWCHVMAHESFEDPDTAALMNRHFVPIKVDREERPDIDHLYMNALHALGEQGGWPLTMFAAPDGSPFWGGTYFPPEPRWGRPSFRQVLAGIAKAWAEGDELVTHNTAALRRALDAMAAARPGAGIAPADLDRAATTLLRLTDPEQGGLRGAPKFPNPAIFRFIWQNDFRTGNTQGGNTQGGNTQGGNTQGGNTQGGNTQGGNTQGGNTQAHDALHLLLRRMSQGGIYDHLGGGYARYATDAIWLVPHFEKMLYDNAQLLELLAFAQSDSPDPLYAARAAETVGWLDRDMTANGAFAASEDADSEGEEGRFYVWTKAEVDALLGADAAGFAQAYDVTAEGNWEGHTILRRVTPPGSAEQEAALARSRDVLFAARAMRIRPGRDDKVLADWNGLAIAGLARAAAVFGQPAWLARAAAAFDAVMQCLGTPDGRVRHAWRLGRVTAAGMLEDQAAMARAALALHEATGDAARLAQAIALAEATVAHFADPVGGYYATADDADDVPLVRSRNAGDNATPAGNGLIGEVFARLHHLTGDAIWRTRAAGVLTAFSGQPDQLAGMPTLLAAADLLEEAASVVIVGGNPRADALAAVALSAPDPAVVVLRIADAAALPASHPAHGKAPGSAGAAAFVCRRNACSLPVAEPAALAAMLRHRAPT
jgi:uncharacterized protein YyaL (SSP411 family)